MSKAFAFLLLLCIAELALTTQARPLPDIFANELFDLTRLLPIVGRKLHEVHELWKSYKSRFNKNFEGGYLRSNSMQK